MSVSAWPFLISRNRTIGYTTIVVPQFINEAHAAGMLALAAGGETEDPNRVLYREVDGSIVGDLTIMFRIVQAEQRDIGLAGSDPLRDQFGRPIRLIEGIAFRGHVPDIAITQKCLQDVHNDVVNSYKIFWEADDSPFTVHSSLPFFLHTSDVTKNDQQVRFIKEPSFRPSAKKESLLKQQEMAPKWPKTVSFPVSGKVQVKQKDPPRRRVRLLTGELSSPSLYCWFLF